MKYSIITPTYNRPEKLIRCVESVLNQKVSMENGKEVSGFDFEVIIINDSPLFDYSIFDKYLETLSSENKSKIKYFVNKENMGVNYSRNLALDYIKDDKASDYVIFLDDDDWLSGDALGAVSVAIKNNPNQKWYVSNRAKEKGDSLTKNRTNKNILNYFFDYLLTKRFSGDVTHIIKSSLSKKYKFSTKIKNGEEWIYFIQIPNSFYYYNHNSTLTEGYDVGGVNTSMQKTYLANTEILFGEIKNWKIFVVLVLRLFLYLFRKYNKGRSSEPLNTKIGLDRH